jgi:hypothetical protein
MRIKREFIGWQDYQNKLAEWHHVEREGIDD